MTPSARGPHEKAVPHVTIILGTRDHRSLKSVPKFSNQFAHLLNIVYNGIEQLYQSVIFLKQ